jgi:predicted MFS family arabinose efflux permease
MTPQASRAHPAPRGLRGAGAAAVTAAAFLVVMLGTTLPTPLYPLYQRDLGFGSATSTLVFATYAVGVAAALVLVGRVSDQVGRRATLLPGLGLAALSNVAFLVPDSLTALFVGRALSGLSAGIFTGTATAMLADLAPSGRQRRYGLLAAAVNMLGLGAGPVLAGTVAAFTSAPLVLPYLIHLALLAVATVGLWAVVEPIETTGAPVRWRPQALGVPRAIRGVFVRAGVAGSAGFAVLGLFAAVAPAFLGEVLGVTDHLVVGLVVGSLFGFSAIGQIASTRLTEHRALLTGTATLAIGVASIGAAVAVASLPVFLIGAAVAGAGQGMSFRAGLGAVTAAAPAQRRGAVTSSFFLVLYGAIALPVIGVGAAADVFGLAPAGVVFAVTTGGIAALVFAGLVGDRRS